MSGTSLPMVPYANVPAAQPPLSKNERVKLLWIKFTVELRDSLFMKVAVVWVLLVVISGAWLFFLICGVNMPDPNTNDWWVELMSQILCGLFQIAAMWKWPGRIRSLYWWFAKPQRSQEEYPDISRCVALVCIIFLHLNIYFQYAVAYFMWRWWFNWQNRPPWAVPVFLVLSFLSEACVGGYLLFAHRRKKKMDELSSDKVSTADHLNPNAPPWRADHRPPPPPPPPHHQPLPQWYPYPEDYYGPIGTNRPPVDQRLIRDFGPPSSPTSSGTPPQEAAGLGVFVETPYQTGGPKAHPPHPYYHHTY
eukprot:NODE_1074_length_1123_cov_177.879888_g822_i0.p1 GENE.NODE_1074_length_1123_cov_177.879888_g822_i0~~NODE_1074_length_1123_cov_177.879888_g822_i0.p1  ORF type:complete len:306 (+),score=33.64 NODE_1074_length_1123_cov_177.879888_g822_i0:55-972(+)